MAREFGVLSYQPENIGFVMNGKIGKWNEPWRFLNRSLCRNILIAAYRTPSTAEELAVELGVALPYMEDELKDLVWDELLRQNGKKYETNIFIVSASAQERIYARLKTVAGDLTEKIIAVIENQVKSFEENGFQWHEGYQPYEDMKWAYLMLKTDEINHGVLADFNKTQKSFDNSSPKLGRYGHTKRPDGGEWDVLGMEEYSGAQPSFVGLHGTMDTPEDEAFINFGQFKFKYKGIEHKTPVHITYEHVKALAAAAKKDISGVPPRILRELADYGYLTSGGSNSEPRDLERPAHASGEGVYQPAFRVTFREKIGALTPEQAARHDCLYRAAYDVLRLHYDFCREVILNEVPLFLRDDPYIVEHACANVFAVRGAVLESALEKGYLTYAENDERRMLGAYLIV